MLNETPLSSPAKALKRLCAVGQSATPATAGAMRTKASSPTSFFFKFENRFLLVRIYICECIHLVKETITQSIFRRMICTPK